MYCIRGDAMDAMDEKARQYLLVSRRDGRARGICHARGWGKLSQRVRWIERLYMGYDFVALTKRGLTTMRVTNWENEERNDGLVRFMNSK